MTRARWLVYEALAKLDGHRSADEVHQSLVSQGSQISRTSVYSTLEILTGTGLVMAADVGPGRALYETGTRWHHHAVCRVCEEVSDIECAIGAKPCLTASGDWGQVDEAQVIFRGVCLQCLQQQRKRPRRQIEETAHVGRTAHTAHTADTNQRRKRRRSD